MNLKEAAGVIGVHYQTAYKWVRSGELAAIKVKGGYEISDTAVEAFRRRRAAVRELAERAAAPRARARRLHDDEDVVGVLRGMIDLITTDASPVLSSAVRLAAESLGDTFTLSLRTPGSDDATVVAFHHPDPRRLVLLAEGVHEGIRPGGLGYAARVFATGTTTHVRHLSQQLTRGLVLPEYEQFFDEIGVFSLVVAPVFLFEDVVGALGGYRSVPGVPISDWEREFVEQIASLIGEAMTAAETRAPAWRLRRVVTERFEQLLAGRRDSELRELMDRVRALDPAYAVALLSPDRRVLAATAAYAAAYGVGVDDMVGDRLQSFEPEDDPHTTHLRLIAGELHYARETRATGAGEQRRDIHVLQSAIRLSDARVVAILEVLSDAGGPATAATRAARADQLAATVSTLGEPLG
jgi:excisionase family DNA binding protein